MNHVDAWVGGAALALSIILGITWTRAVERVRVERWLPALNVIAASSIGLGTVGLFIASGPWPRLVSALALPLGLVFFGVQWAARQPRRRVAVHVGGPILEFAALDGTGARFELSSLHGTAYLLKFYRGHW